MFYSLQKKNFPNSHLGNDFHIYELLWTPEEISLSIDGIKYGSLSTNLRESALAAKIKSAINWANNGPFDKEVNAILLYSLLPFYYFIFHSFENHEVISFIGF